MDDCNRELFDKVNAAIDALENETVGPSGFVPFVEKKFLVAPWNSSRVRAARENIPARIAELRSLAGLLVASVSQRATEAEPSSPLLPPPVAVSGTDAAPIDPPPPGDDRAAWLASHGIGEGDAWRVVDGAPVKVDASDVESVLDAIEHKERRADGSPAVTREQAAALGEWLAGAWDRAYDEPFEPAGYPGPGGNPFPPTGRRALFVQPYQRDANDYYEKLHAKLNPGAPPLSGALPPAPEPPPPAPPPPAPPPAPEPPPPPAPPPTPTPGEQPVRLIRYESVTRARESAWGILSQPPADLAEPRAYIASRHIVLDASMIRNRKALDKLLSREDEELRQSGGKRLSAEKVSSFVQRIGDVVATGGGVKIITAADYDPPPVAFELAGVQGVRFVAFPTTVNGVVGAPVVANLDTFIFARGWLAGNKGFWYAVTVPGKRGAPWRGLVFAPHEGDRIGAVVAAPEVVIPDEVWREIAALRGAGAYSEDPTR